jgi:hypothetical protein
MLGPAIILRDEIALAYSDFLAKNDQTFPAACGGQGSRAHKVSDRPGAKASLRIGLADRERNLEDYSGAKSTWRPMPFGSNKAWSAIGSFAHSGQLLRDSCREPIFDSRQSSIKQLGVAHLVRQRILL